ncbi:MAG: hypothetical protein E6I82_03380 [Chloroflexi bacterium]|nr:MAG: hypothetical protein E6I82_03380 [Chloroflexota bacterium]
MEYASGPGALEFSAWPYLKPSHSTSFSITRARSSTGPPDCSTPCSARVVATSRGRLAFQAAEAARRQGLFDGLHGRLLLARHRDQLDLDDREVVEKIAADAAVDVGRFQSDVDDPAILESLARDHREGVLEHGVFGTPTFVFADGASAYGASAYVRLSERVNESGAVEVFDRLMAVAAAEPRILEIKRPRRPSQP